MPLYKFSQSDIFHNRIEAHPRCNFFIYSGSSYYNNRPELSGAYISNVPSVPTGHVSLYELNVDRVSGSREDFDAGAFTKSPDIIYPFIIKNGDNTRFRGTSLATVDGTNLLFDEVAQYGDMITGSYPMSASIVKEYLAADHVERAVVEINAATLGVSPTIHPYVDEFGYPTKSLLGPKIAALRNTLNNYIYLSPHYAYSSSSYANRGAGPLAGEDPSVSVNWNKARQEMGLISIPSIFYGREIERGTVNLKFYITGTLIGELNDENKNGELVQVGPADSPYSGSTAGVVLYSEGFLLLTGSWDLTANPVAATADINFDDEPANNDKITLVDVEGNSVVFKFNTGDNFFDGRLHSDETSINIGIAAGGAGLAATRFSDAVNNVNSYSANNKTLNIGATVPSTFKVTLTQDTAGLAGNTDITIVSSVIQGPVPSRFSNARGGVSGPPKTEKYYAPATATSPRWIDFAQTIATGSVHMPSSSFELDFNGTTYTPVMTMLAHARKGHLNFSNNPTYIKHSQSLDPVTGSTKFKEQPELEIKNIVSSSYDEYSAPYKRQTYISKIGIYDAKRNLIGIAKVATPVKKTEERDFTFKLKLDF